MKLKTAIVGWRGMVGSVLLERMAAEGDFETIEADFLSTSQVGSPAPRGGGLLLDAMNLELLSGYQVIVSCQGGSYTEAIHGALRASDWQGFWIDAASTLRLKGDSVIVLDPVNRSAIDSAIEQGKRDFVGGNCTVSLLLMALQPLIERGWVKWINTMTYQAVSGAGAAAVLELIEQNRKQVQAIEDRQAALGTVGSERTSVLDLIRMVDVPVHEETAQNSSFGAPIASNIVPWIGCEMDSGQTREEWKGHAEAQKILGLDAPLPIDGLCVRVPSFRCHSQAVTLQLTGPVSLEDLEAGLRSGHQWLDYVANDREETLNRLTPAAVSGSLGIAVGRLHALAAGENLVALFTVGDQLLWGAAEPLRRMLRIVTDKAATGGLR